MRGTLTLAYKSDGHRYQTGHAPSMKVVDLRVNLHSHEKGMIMEVFNEHGVAYEMHWASVEVFSRVIIIRGVEPRGGNRYTYQEAYFVPEGMKGQED